MIEGIMKKFGYKKVPEGVYGIKEGSIEDKILDTVLEARSQKKDMMIDYVKKTSQLKFYRKEGKKLKLVMVV